MADQDAKNQRSAAKGRFTRKLAELTKSIEEDKKSEIVRVNFEELNEAWRNVETKHEMYTTFLKDSEVEESEVWIAELQRSFSEAIEKQVEYIGSNAAKAMVEKQVLSQQEAAKNDCEKTQTKVQVGVKNLEAKATNLRLELIKIPRFSGELREYPRFRKDFEVQVMLSLDSSTALYTLRSYLCEGPLAVVRGVDDDIDEMWRRLDEKYGDPAKITDVIINSIQRVKAIKEGEDKRFVEFVEVIESGYRDLLRLGLEKEITTTSSVSIIEKRLPADIRREWARLVSSDSSSVDKKNKFPGLLKFLLNQKRAIEYDLSDLRAFGSLGSQAGQQSVHCADAVAEDLKENKQQPFESKSSSACLFHNSASHGTDECQLYLSKICGERMDMLRERVHAGPV